MFSKISVGRQPEARYADTISTITSFAMSWRSASKSKSVFFKRLREPMNWLCDFSKYQEHVSDDNVPRRVVGAAYVLQLYCLLSLSHNLEMEKQVGGKLFVGTKDPRIIFNVRNAMGVAVCFTNGRMQIQTKLTVAAALLKRAVKLVRASSGSDSKLSQCGLSSIRPLTSPKEEL